MSDKVFNVLFICTGNSARSILGEALLNEMGRGRFRAFSAGSHPKGSVHALAVRELQRRGISTEGLRSKGWEEFARPGAPEMDFIFTVCDQAAGEVCPVWPGQPMTAHSAWTACPCASRSPILASAEMTRHILVLCTHNSA
ncbi:MAG: arsenate reductase ArsC, partial [Betaproteobacteria bacterium]|nr:arsenate reductase ArsC [Betaproteobacteria bacterium]